MSKRNDIIYTAIRLFNENSFHSVGIDRIITESNVAKMTFYKYFPSKEQLIHDCLLQRRLDIQNVITTRMANYPDQPLEQLYAIFVCYDQWFEQPCFNGSLFQKAIEELNGLYPALMEPAKAYKLWLCQVILELLQQLNLANPLPLKAILISLLDGMTIQAHVNHQTVQLDEYWHRVCLLLQAEPKV
jgi:AcrR family transcriptional regulator